ncbi:hypothetical protein HELRODRAFT_93668 [Helobdella robusta]|uniref:CBM21 domain-containing protein n=1 Tax=Helobdella robusta TaxID=6412 RepID=T1G8X3_HELRO|nr:hypothetical protein HELRODRAFT_93668 [Helobdella robusta]ESO13117.1 hypothetical protein HELRODRAFT_93668 [Helobdella robusta]
MGDSSEKVEPPISQINSTDLDPILKHLQKCDSFTDNSDSAFHYAKFSLSMSDNESIKTNRSSISSMGGYEYDDINYPGDHLMKFEPGNLRLSLILGISEDEKAENRLACANHFQPYSPQSNNFSQDSEFDFLKEKSLRKCISLKSNKTPPTTPTKKKAVRFADALGLDLASIRHVIDLDQPPIVPDYAMRDLNLKSDPIVLLNSQQQTRRLCICFSSPENCPDFFKRVQERKVLLENCFVDDNRGLVYGKIRVMNVAFHKSVSIRYTLNSWLTNDDIPARYESSSDDKATDKFAYTIIIPDYFRLGNSLEFSIMYTTANQTFWDNNYGSNYRIECYMTNESNNIF